MEFVKLAYDEYRYVYSDASDIKMCILGLFLSVDARCGNEVVPWREFALREDWDGSSGNITRVKKEEDGFIYLSDMYPDEDLAVPAELKMTVQQFEQLLDDWQEEVCKLRPKEVVIKYEGGQFLLETSNSSDAA